METAISDISDLILQARSGDTAAFGQIVRRYQGLVSGVLFSVTGDFHKSEDLAQETFLIAWNKLGELENTENPAPWLCTIARNLVNRSFRKKSVNTVHGSLEDEITSAEPEPSTELQRREQSELVWSAIGEMDEKYRETLVLYYRSGQSVAEIAEASALTEEAVRQRLVRARKSLKSKLEQMIGDILTDTAPGDVFTYGVMAAVTGAVVTATTQTAIAATTGAGTTAVLGSGGIGGGGKTLGMATFWNILGPLAYLVWIFSFIWVSLWAQIRNTPTLRARRYRLYTIFRNCQNAGIGIIVSSLPVALCLWWSSFLGVDLSTFLLPCFVLSVCMLICLPIYGYFDRRIKSVVEEDLHLPGKRYGVPSYDVPAIERRFFRALFVNLLLVETVIAFYLAFLLYTRTSVYNWFHHWQIGMILVAGFVFILLAAFFQSCNLLGRQLIDMVRSKENFLATPPVIDNPFEVALGRSFKSQISIDRPQQAGKMYGIAVLAWLAIAAGAIWFFAYFIDWHRNPLLSGLCILLLFVAAPIQGRIVLRAKNRKSAHLSNAFFGLFDAALILLLAKLQSESFSLNSIWQGMNSFENANSLFLMIWPYMFACFAIVSIVSLIQWSREKPLQEELAITNEPIPDEDRAIGRWVERQADNRNREPFYSDEDIQEAACRYEPEDEPRQEPCCFSRSWAWICGVYAIIISAVFSYQLAFPGPTIQKNVLMQRGDFDALIRLEPENAEYYFRRSWQSESRTWEQMLEDIDTAIRLKPDYGWAYRRRADLLVDKESPSSTELQQALTDIDKAVQLNPKDASARQTRARVHEKLGNLDASVVDMAEVIRLTQPPARAFGDDWMDQRMFMYEDRCRLNELRQDYRAAIDDCTNSLKLAERDKNVPKTHLQDLYRRRAELYEKLGEHGKANADLEKAK